MENITYWDAYDTAGIGVGGYTDRDLLDAHALGKILDVGCGRGRMLSQLNGDKYGLDPSERAITTAKEEYTDINWVVGDATNLPFPDNFFDFVYSIEVIEHVRDSDKMIEEIWRVLRPGGYAFIQTPNYPIKRVYDILFWFFRRKRTWRDDYTHVSKFSASRLKKMISKLFSIEVIETRNILLENRFSFIKSLRKRNIQLSRWIGQKTIILGRKISN